MTDTLDSHQYAYQVADNTEWMESRDATFWQRLNRLYLSSGSFVGVWGLRRHIKLAHSSAG